tara:strand:+ start:271 stop:504 length:234 start_codon:yes stop_codon:yes gene_type:complete
MKLSPKVKQILSKKTLLERVDDVAHAHINLNISLPDLCNAYKLDHRQTQNLIYKSPKYLKLVKDKLKRYSSGKNVKE